jgi:EpsI family protein
MAHLQLRSPLPGYFLFLVAIAGALLLFGSAIAQLYSVWNEQPEYSYGILIPFVSGFLIWRERGQLRGLPFTGSWYGLVLIVVGLALRLVGQLSTMPALVHYALLLVLYGLVLALTGPIVFRRLFMPLFILMFMVPLPPVLSNQLSVELQLLSSQIGVWVIRAAGISVFLEGNVIDLGSYQLEVAQACSGLRYLFPLMTLSFLTASSVRLPIWKRTIVFLSSIPITVLMNSLRIGLIGMTVERWGTRMAEGLLHEFEGWLVFMVSTLLVVLIAIGLARIGPFKRVSSGPAQAPTPTRPTTAVPTAARSETGAVPAARHAAAVSTTRSGPTAPRSTAAAFQTVPRSFIAAAVVVAVGVAAEFATPDRPEIPPARAQFVDFPTQLGPWTGTPDRLDQVYLDALHLNDYLLMNYRDGGDLPINLYVAFYQSQRSGLSVHSPRLCLPGGGWKILQFEQYSIPTANGHSSWPVNRVLIEQGGQRNLVYYWFRERGRRLTNEYVVRWYLFWDALEMNRTDGALVRLVIPIPKGVREADIDGQLTRFAQLSETQLGRYVPD